MQLYVADYLGDTRHLTTEQHGAYLLLLMAMWRYGGTLPNDRSKLARITGLSEPRWARIEGDVIEFFVVENGVLTHVRVQKELTKANATARQRSESGKKGAKAKSLKNNDDAQAIAEAGLKHTRGTQISESDTSEDKSSSVCFPEKRKLRASTMASEIQTAFDDWWSYYPLKKSKADALKAFPKALELAGALEVLVAATKRYATEVIGLDPSKIKHPSGWLNGRRWEDEPASQQGLIINGRTAQPSNNHTAKRDRMLRAIVSLSDRDSRWRSGD